MGRSTGRGIGAPEFSRRKQRQLLRSDFFSGTHLFFLKLEFGGSRYRFCYTTEMGGSHKPGRELKSQNGPAGGGSLFKLIGSGCLRVDQLGVSFLRLPPAPTKPRCNDVLLVSLESLQKKGYQLQKKKTSHLFCSPKRGGTQLQKQVTRHLLLLWRV